MYHSNALAWKTVDQSHLKRLNCSQMTTAMLFYIIRRKWLIGECVMPNTLLMSIIVKFYTQSFICQIGISFVCFQNHLVHLSLHSRHNHIVARHTASKSQASAHPWICSNHACQWGPMKPDWSYTRGLSLITKTALFTLNPSIIFNSPLVR